jgi:hypothetical protein
MNDSVDVLRSAAQQFCSLTEAMLAAAQQGSWDDFLAQHVLREQQMTVLLGQDKALLIQLLPALRASLQQALEHSRRLDQLVRARRDELGEILSSGQRARRLRSTYTR